MVGRYFSTHPLTTERIDKIKLYVDKNKMLDDNMKFYVGKRNYVEKIPMSVQMYKEELLSDYPSIKDEETTKKDTVEQSIDEQLIELYTVHGRLFVGMELADAEKILPPQAIKFKRAERVGYKDIRIYKVDSKDLQETVGIVLELENNKVAQIRIIK